MVGLRAMAAADAMRRAQPPPPARKHPAAVAVAAGMKVMRRKRMARRMGEVQRVSEPPSVEKTDKVRAMDCYNAHEEDGAGSATRRARPPPPAREHPAVETVTSGMKITRRKRTARRTGEVQRVSEPTGVGKTEEVRAMEYSYNAHGEDGAESATRRPRTPPPAREEHPVAITFPTGMKVTRRKRTAMRAREVQRVPEPPGVEKTEDVRGMDCRNAHVAEGAEKGGKRKREDEAQRVEERMEEVRAREEPREKRRAMEEMCFTKRVTATDAKRDQNRLEVGLGDFKDSMPLLELARTAHSLPYINVPVQVPASDKHDEEYTFMFSYMKSNGRYRFRGPEYAKFLQRNEVTEGQLMSVVCLPAAGSVLDRRFAFLNSNPN